MKEALAGSRTALESARETLQVADRTRRETARAIDDAPAGQAQSAKDAHDLAVLASRVASERVQLRELELRLAEGRLKAFEADDPLGGDEDDSIDAMRERLAAGRVRTRSTLRS